MSLTEQDRIKNLIYEESDVLDSDDPDYNSYAGWGTTQKSRSTSKSSIR
jgi:hypothetical protein